MADNSQRPCHLKQLNSNTDCVPAPGWAPELGDAVWRTKDTGKIPERVLELTIVPQDRASAFYF